MDIKEQRILGLSRALSKIGGTSGLPDGIRSAAAEAALEDEPDAAIEALANAWVGAEGVAVDLKVRIATLTAEKKAADMAVEAAKDAILNYLQDVGQGSVDLPRFEIDVRPGKPGISISDPDILPARFVKTERKPLLNELKEAVLKDGEAIDGVSVSNGSSYLQLRAKRRIAA